MHLRRHIGKVCDDLAQQCLALSYGVIVGEMVLQCLEAVTLKAIFAGFKELVEEVAEILGSAVHLGSVLLNLARQCIRSLQRGKIPPLLTILTMGIHYEQSPRNTGVAKSL